METIVFQAVGNYESMPIGISKEMHCIKITLKQAFKKAIIKLEHYSHCILFTKNEQMLFCYGAKITAIHEKGGELTVEGAPMQGELVDIKPYFPCEERVVGTVPQQGFLPIPFRGHPIGEYLFVHHQGILQFKEGEKLAGQDIKATLKGIQAGDYVRVLWWFHRFDKEEYRKHCMCNPPYENAPSCGVFATRSPVRPNPLASTLVQVTAVDPHNDSLAIRGFDGFEHSRILQMMPYTDVPVFEDVQVPSWVAHWTGYKAFPETSIQHEDIDTAAETDDTAVVYVEELETDSSWTLETVNPHEIVVEHANIHNLKDISVRIPKEKITVITGVSGSGKSSLAFDTIYQESQRQFIDLVSANSPIGNDLNDAKVEKITGLQPSIAIEQRNLGLNPRSTVGSVTRTGDYLRLLFATIGQRFCPHCRTPIPENNVCEGCGTIFFAPTPALFNYNHPEAMCPVCKGLGEELQIDPALIVSDPEKSILEGASIWWGNLRKHREKPNANWMRGEVLALAEDMKEDLELPFKSLSEGFKEQLFYGSNGREVSLTYANTNGRKGTITRPVEGVVNTLYRLLKDTQAEKSMAHLERFIVNKQCSRCHGERLMEEGRWVNINGTRYPQAAVMNIEKLTNWCHATYHHLPELQKEKTKGIFKKLLYRLRKLDQVGLSYLCLDRSIPTLSGGEAQRLKIATQFGTGLSNILYIMDEPSKGLHPRDYQFLMKTISDLRKLNNTVIMVEHKKAFLHMADYIIEIGPGAGHYGGQLIRAQEIATHPEEAMDEFCFSVKGNDIKGHKTLTLKGASTHNLKQVDITLPLGQLICVIGVSGSGKSSLVSKTLYPAVCKAIGKSVDVIGEYEDILGAAHLREVHYVSQKPIGKTPRSNPGTYTGVFDLIRDFYASLQDAKKKKLTKEHFSFNSVKGQCEECKGAGQRTIPMHFMQDLYATCTKCGGTRYQDKVLEVKYQGHSISDLLAMEIGEVQALFKEEKKIFAILDMLVKVGVGYIRLGQSATTLSGGEAQRIKLAKELCAGKAKDVLYILDEPTTGLHDEDVKKLIFILKELTRSGATVIVIEHNPLLIRQSDWLIEMGPKAGDLGGAVIKEGWMY